MRVTYELRQQFYTVAHFDTAWLKYALFIVAANGDADYFGKELKKLHLLWGVGGLELGDYCVEEHL